MGVHVMADLETFGNGRKALPISIGAVKFDKTGILDRFHVGIDPATAQSVGLQLTVDTMLWWLDDDRRDAWHAWLALEKVDIFAALSGFGSWVITPLGPRPGDPCGVAEDNGPVALWGNGSTFDNVILRDAYATCSMEYPFEFWQDQCYRTMKYRRPDIKLKRFGVHHSAVDDAVSQALHLIELCEAMGVEL